MKYYGFKHQHIHNISGNRTIKHKNICKTRTCYCLFCEIEGESKDTRVHKKRARREAKQFIENETKYL